MLESFIRSLHHVKELKTGIDFYKAFSCLEAKGFNSPSNLKVVEVTNQSSDTDSTDLSDYSDDDSSVDDTDSMERGDCSDNDSSFDDQDAEQVGDEGNPAAGREVGADDAGPGDDVGAEEADVRHED
uniref:dentin sialophosphoprotein-like isoform X2 n=1 Tax=Erigeron canadensis TaxID=72917 RepID=UPI001CB89417|nr:dentin sialophosphoprotein-like isoform X2 [Erigeron canadensis]